MGPVGRAPGYSEAKWSVSQRRAPKAPSASRDRLQGRLQAWPQVVKLRVCVPSRPCSLPSAHSRRPRRRCWASNRLRRSRRAPISSTST